MSSTSACRCQCAASSPTIGSRPTAAASHCSAARSSLRSSGLTTPAAASETRTRQQTAVVVGVQAGPAWRRQVITGRAWRTRCRRMAPGRARRSLHGDSVLRVGQPWTRRDGGLDRPDGRLRATRSRADAGHHGHRHDLSSRRLPISSTTAKNPRPRTTRPCTSTGGPRRARPSGPNRARQTIAGFGSGRLLVQRHGPRAGARASRLARALSPRRRMAARGDR